MTHHDDEMLADADLEPMLRMHLSSRLDAQRGRALAAFERQASVLPAAPRHRFIGLMIASAIAASLVWAWMLLPGHADHPRSGEMAIGTTELLPEIPATAGDFPPEGAESVIVSQAFDEGSQIIDQLPVRRVRLRSVEEIRWDDPDLGATVRVAVPREQVILVRQQTF